MSLHLWRSAKGAHLVWLVWNLGRFPHTAGDSDSCHDCNMFVVVAVAVVVVVVVVVAGVVVLVVSSSSSGSYSFL